MSPLPWGTIKRRAARWAYVVLAAVGASGTAAYKCAAHASCDFDGIVDDYTGECLHDDKGSDQ